MLCCYYYYYYYIYIYIYWGRGGTEYGIETVARHEEEKRATRTSNPIPTRKPKPEEER